MYSIISHTHYQSSIEDNKVGKTYGPLAIFGDLWCEERKKKRKKKRQLAEKFLNRENFFILEKREREGGKRWSACVQMLGRNGGKKKYTPWLSSRCIRVTTLKCESSRTNYFTATFLQQLTFTNDGDIFNVSAIHCGHNNITRYQHHNFIICNILVNFKPFF